MQRRRHNRVMSTSRIPGRRFLHSPGPTHLPDEVLDALHRQPMDLADPRLADALEDCDAGLRRLLATEAGEVFMYAANGHGAWEVVIENLLPVGGTVLIPGTGHFSDSWALQCEALGRRALRTPWREGHPIDPADVLAALQADRAREIVAVFVVHTDTASSVTSDLDALRCALQVLDGAPAPQGLAVYSRSVRRAPPGILLRVMPDRASEVAHELFAALRDFDARGARLIWVEAVPSGPEWEGVRDRLARAAAA